MDVLAVFIVVQDVDTLMQFSESHLIHVVVCDSDPLGIRDVLASRQAQRVVPDRLFDVWAQRAGGLELAGKIARRGADHVAANLHAVVIAGVKFLVFVAVESVIQRATEAATSADLTHPLHRPPPPRQSASGAGRQAGRAGCPAPAGRRSWPAWRAGSGSRRSGSTRGKPCG